MNNQKYWQYNTTILLDGMFPVILTESNANKCAALLPQNFDYKISINRS